MRHQIEFPLVFDDAALFPPGNLGLAEAVEAHQHHRRTRYADLVGPLVVGLEHRGAIEDLVHASGRGLDARQLDLAVVVADAAGAAEALELASQIEGVRLAGLEVRSARRAEVEQVLAGGVKEGAPVVSLELPRGQGAADVIADLAGSAYRAKIRTGGLEASAFPTVSELAATVAALASARVPFKATAGLHRALRHADAAGWEHHGFLNLLVATQAATGGASLEAIEAVLAERDAARLPGLRSLGNTSLLCAIGTCSITEPINDLDAFGLIPRLMEGTR